MLRLSVPADLGSLPSCGRNSSSGSPSRESGQDAYDLCLAWEAAANAVEHPDESLEPVIELTAEGDRNGVCVTVRDFGRWRPVRLAADRG